MHPRQQTRNGFTLIELLVTIAIIGVLIALLLPAVQQARESARRTQCRSHLKQLSLSLHNYHSTHNILPSGSLTVGPAFIPFSGWGWGAMVLPFVDQSVLYNQIDFSSNTAVGFNRTVIQSPLSLWFCPSDASPSRITVTSQSGEVIQAAAGSYMGVECMLTDISSVRFRDVTDGLSQTFFLSEHKYQRKNAVKETTASWLGRVTFSDHFVFDCVPHAQTGVLTPINKSVFSSQHAGGVLFSFGDGSVQFISESIDMGLYEAMGTRAGGEVINVPF